MATTTTTTRDFVLVPAQPATCGIAVDVTADGRDHGGTPCERDADHDGACHPDGMVGAMLVDERVEVAAIRARHYAEAHHGAALVDGTRIHPGSLAYSTGARSVVRVERTHGPVVQVRAPGSLAYQTHPATLTTATGRTGGHRVVNRDDAAGYDRGLYAAGIVRPV